MAFPIKRPIINASGNMSFKAAETIEPGQAVYPSGADAVSVGDGTGEPIGWAQYDHAHVAANQRTAYNSGEVVPVKLRNPLIQVGVTATAVSVGDFLAKSVLGRYVTEVGTKSVNSALIAFEASSGTSEIKAMPI